MTKTESHTPADLADMDVGATALSALVKAMARVAAKADFSADQRANDGPQQKDPTDEH